MRRQRRLARRKRRFGGILSVDRLHLACWPTPAARAPRTRMGRREAACRRAARRTTAAEKSSRPRPVIDSLSMRMTAQARCTSAAHALGVEAAVPLRRGIFGSRSQRRGTRRGDNRVDRARVVIAVGEACREFRRKTHPQGVSRLPAAAKMSDHAAQHVQEV